MKIVFMLFKILGISVLAIILLIVLVIGVLLSPIPTMRARSQIRSYVNRHFPEYDLHVARPERGAHFWSGDLFTFWSEVSSTDGEFSFTVTTLPSGAIWNTYGNVLASRTRMVLTHEFGENSVHRVSVPRVTSTVNPRLHNGIRIELNTDDVTPAAMYEAIAKSRQLTNESVYRFPQYTFQFITGDGMSVIIHALRTQPTGEELMSVLEGIYNDFVSPGNYSNISHSMRSGTTGRN